MRDRVRAAALLAAVLIPYGCAAHQPDTRPETGRLTVGVRTDTPDRTPGTVRVMLDGRASSVAADGGIVTIDQLPPGEHDLRLDGLPGSCSVEGGAARRVAIRARQTTAVRFSIACQEPLPE
jgi:hypothetical protein